MNLTDRVLILIQPEHELIELLDENDLPLTVAKSPLDASYLQSRHPEHILAYCSGSWGLAVTGQLSGLPTEHPRITLMLGKPEDEAWKITQQAAHHLDAYPIIDATNRAALLILRLLVSGHSWAEVRERLTEDTP